MKAILISCCVFFTFYTNAQVTKVGNDTLTDIACWNVEWFGDATSGPSNEALQFTNIKTVIQNTDLDVWGLCEVSNPTTFNDLLTALPAYDGVNSTYSATQKLALVWKKSQFELISFQNLPTAPSFEFASRRPLEVALKTKNNSQVDTFYFYVVHFKANENRTDEPSYNRRKAAMEWLKTYLEQNRPNQKVIVLGDYNDDVDESVITIGGLQAQTPFASVVNDSARYFFPSKRLSLAGLTSYPNFNPPNMIDHIMNTTALSDSFYVKESSAVMSQLGNQINQFTSTTSDHYPVYARYDLKRRTQPTVGLKEVQPIPVSIFPNPAKQFVTIDIASPVTEVKLTNVLGQTVLLSNQSQLDISRIKSGIYTITIQTAIGTAIERLVIE